MNNWGTRIDLILAANGESQDVRLNAPIVYTQYPAAAFFNRDKQAMV